MPYNCDWARSVYVDFCRVRTRTNNLERALAERASELDPRMRALPPDATYRAIVAAIQQPEMQQIWRKFKKIYKRETYTQQEFDMVAKHVLFHAYRELEGRLQLELRF